MVRETQERAWKSRWDHNVNLQTRRGYMSFLGNFKENLQKLFRQKDAPSHDSSSEEISEPSSQDTHGIKGRGSRDLKNEAGAPSVESEITSARSLFKIRKLPEDRLEFYSLLDNYRLFCTRARITGDLASFFGEKDASGIIPSIVEVPVDPGETIRVQTFNRAKSNHSEKFHILAAALKEAGDGTKLATFTFNLGPEEIAFEFLLPAPLPCLDFKEVIETKKVFEQIPPVSHMGMLIKTYLLVEKPGGEEADVMLTLMKLAAGIPNDRVQKLLTETPEILQKLTHIECAGIDFLRDYLNQQNIQIHSSHLASLCIFLEIETGNISRDNWETRGIEEGKLPFSPYSIMAITDALGFKLRAFEIDEDDNFKAALSNLFLLSGGSLIAQIENGGGRGYALLTSQEQIAETEISGSSFSGVFLCQISLIEHLTKSDLETLLKTREFLMACYQSDFDKRIVWKKLHFDEIAVDETENSALSMDRGAHHFYRGFRSFQFMKAVFGKIIPESPLSDVAHGTVVIHLDSRGSRQYQWVENDEALNNYKSIMSADWTFSEEKLLFPEVESLPEYLFEAKLHRLLDRPSGVSAEEQTLSLLQPKINMLLTHYPPYRDIFEDATFVRKMRDCLHNRESLLLKYISAKTLEAMLKYIMNAEGEKKLNIKLLEPLMDDPENAAVTILTSYLLISSLCLSKLTEVKGHFKSFDDKNFRFFLRNHISELLDSPDAKIRKLAIKLFATSNVVANRSELLMVEYDIERGLKDPDPEVRDSALNSRLALIMRKKIPLHSPVLVEPTEAVAEAVKPRKSSIWEEKLAMDIAALHGKIDEYIENAASNELRGSISSHESSSADLDISMLPFINEGENKKNIARLIVGVNEALKTLDFDKNRYLFIVSRHQFDNLMEAVLDTWKYLEKREGASFSSLLMRSTKEDLLESFLKAGRERAEKKAGSLPYLGGSHSLMIHRIEPQKIIKAIKTIENKKVSIRRKKIPHKFFIDLIVMGSQFGLKNLRICRVHKAGGEDIDLLENKLTSFSTSREIQVHDIDVFNYRLARFIPFFHLLNMKTQHFSSDDDSWELANLLLGFYDSFLKLPTSSTIAEGETGKTEGGEGETPHIAGASSDIIEISRQVTASFGLHDGISRQIMNMIFDAAPQCLYDIWG
jgi:hypothetical protein